MLYRLGNIEVDTSNFYLSENGSTIAVEPQVFDLIVYLITNRTHLVTRQELFDNLWTGRIVSDTTLSNHIKSARKVLGDDGKKQQVIKTVHGRGYQFVAQLEEVIEGSSTEKNTDPKKPEAEQSSEAEKSIAVLAFTDLSPERDQEYFSDGLSEELINLLAKIPGLRVISRTSTFSFKGKDETTEEIGKQLNVAHILEGSVRKAGGRLRITTQLIQVSDESHLWSETFDETMDDIFKVQDDISQSVIKQLKITLLGDTTKTTEVDPEAYTLFLEAKYLTQQFNSKSTQKAEKVINESIIIDPYYAPSWHLLGAIINDLTSIYHLKPLKEGQEQSNNALQKAIELDPEYALSYASLALILSDNRAFEKAEYNIKKALSLDDANSAIINHASAVAILSGKMEEAIALLQKAVKRDPLLVCFPWNLGSVYLMLNRLDEATNAFKRVEHLLPDGKRLHGFRSWILIDRREYTEAMKEADKDPHEVQRLHAQSAALFALGNKQEADRLLAIIIDKYADTDPSDVAYLYAFRKENDYAFEWLEKALEWKDPSLLWRINFRAFRDMNDPRWGVFLKKLGLPKDHWLVGGKN